jgi:hypothetical protein
MKKVSIVLLVLLMLAIPLVSAQEDDELPDLVLAANPGMHPEGIEWDAEGERFLVGSLTMGTIFAVDDEGNVEPFVEDENLMASIGIHIDTPILISPLRLPRMSRGLPNSVPMTSKLANRFTLQT